MPGENDTPRTGEVRLTSEQIEKIEAFDDWLEETRGARVEWTSNWIAVAESKLADLKAALSQTGGEARPAGWRDISEHDGSEEPVDLWVQYPNGTGRRVAGATFSAPHHDCGQYGQYCDSCPPSGRHWIDEMGWLVVESDDGEPVGRVTHFTPLPSPPDAGGGE